MMKFYCRKCGQRLSAEESQAGRVVYCPSCNAMMTVPQPGQQEQEPLPDIHAFVKRRNLDTPYIEDDVDRSAGKVTTYINAFHICSNICFMLVVLFLVFKGVTAACYNEWYYIVQIFLELLATLFCYAFELMSHHFLLFFCGSIYGVYRNSKNIEMRLRKMNLDS